MKEVKEICTNFKKWYKEADEYGKKAHEQNKSTPAGCLEYSKKP